MTKDEIKKALRIHASKIGTCAECSYFGELACSGKLCNDALDLITEQEKEIERLEDENNRLQEIIKQKDDICYWCENSALQTKINVLTELKTRAFQGYQVGMYIVNTEQIDQMIEELKK